MKPSTIILSLSLLANVGLAIAYFTEPASPLRRTIDSTQSPVGTARPDRPALTPTNQATPPAFSWTTIDTPDIDELARRLKAAGFMPEEVRTILSRCISRLFNPNPAGETAKKPPYWQPTYRVNSTAVQDAERRKQMVEQQRLFRKYLMGPDSIADDPEQLASAKRRMGDLPVEKLQALARIEADYEDLNLKQYAENLYRPGDNSSAEAYRLMEKERLSDIAKILSPEEYDSYELRASPLASRLRYGLESFRPTEDEYKTIFAINKAYEDRLNNPQLDPDARKVLNAEITAKVSDALGADRARDFDAAVNHNSQDQTAGLVSRLGLPARVAVEVRQVQQDLTQRAKDIRANTQLTPDDRSAQLDALARQAETQLTTKLGAAGFEAYSDLKGDWIRGLQPKPATTAKP